MGLEPFELAKTRARIKLISPGLKRVRNYVRIHATTTSAGYSGYEVPSGHTKSEVTIGDILN